tara:strand:+ start:1334 stop:2464 length:1131 start_codon:yes stop_codon:yes gene_type:complete
MKKLKNIILTEEDLRDIISKNIVSERSFYRYSGPRSTSFSTVGGKACSLSSVVTSRLEDEVNSIKSKIEIDAGVDSAGESLVTNVNWVGPIQRSDIVRAADSESQPDDADTWKLEFGWDNKDGTSNNMMLGYRPAIEGMDADGAVTSTSRIKQFVLAKLPLAANSQVNIDSLTGMLTDQASEVWYKDISPVVADWLERWARNDAACDRETRDRVRNRRRGAAGGVTGRGSMTSSTWWNGNERTGSPVENYADVEDSLKRVLIIIRAPASVYEGLVTNISSLKGMQQHAVGSGRYAFLIPNSRMRFNSAYATEASNTWSSNKLLVGAWRQASTNFGRNAISRGKGNPKVKIFLDILAAVTRDQALDASSVSIVFSGR